MTRRRLNAEDELNLKFGDDCRPCALVLSGACRGCDAGENFVDADEPEDVVVLMGRWE